MNTNKTKKALLLKTDGTQLEIQPADGESFKLQELYKLIDCDIVQVVYLNEDMILIVDEEGLLKSDFQINHVASRLAIQARAADGIVGNAVLCPTEWFK